MQPYDWKRGRVDDSPQWPVPDPAAPPLAYADLNRDEVKQWPRQERYPHANEPPQHPLWNSYGPAPGMRAQQGSTGEQTYAVPLYVPLANYRGPGAERAAHIPAPLPLRHTQARYLRQPEYPVGVSPAPQPHGPRFARPDAAPDVETAEQLQLRRNRQPRLERLITDNSEYDIVRPLESRPGVPAVGGMNVGLFLIERRQTGQLFVEKRLRTRDRQDQRRTMFEVNALLQLSGTHSNVVQIEEAGQMTGSPYASLVLEYCDSGTIRDHIDRYTEERKSTPEPFAWHVLAGITAALCTCCYGITDPQDTRPMRGWDALCHLDVKPSNVFLTSKGRNSAYPRVVLGDFGCAFKEVDIYSGAAQEMMQEFYTPDWLPPESRPVLYNKRGIVASCGPHTDIWQAGAVIQAMCRLLGTPHQGLVEEERPCGGKFSAALNNVVTCCMSTNPKDRPTALDLVVEAQKEVGKRGMVF